MNKQLKKIIGDEQQRGESRYTRLLKIDDDIVAQRTGSPSSEIADLVHKGLAYEALEKGANDPVLRSLLRTLDGLVKHRVEEATRPLQEAVKLLHEAVHQNQLFTAAFFLTITARFNFPVNNAEEEQLNELKEACATQANLMVDVILPLPPEELPAS
jgi:hypothetical protein